MAGKVDEKVDAQVDEKVGGKVEAESRAPRAGEVRVARAAKDEARAVVAASVDAAKPPGAATAVGAGRADRRN